MQQGPKPVLDAKLGRRIGTTPRLPQNPFSAPVGVTFPGVNASGTQRPGRHPAQISPLGGCQSRCLSSAPITVAATHRQHRPTHRNPICRWSKDEMGRRASSMRGPKTQEAPPSGMTSTKPISPTSPAEPHVWLTNMVKDQHVSVFGLSVCLNAKYHHVAPRPYWAAGLQLFPGPPNPVALQDSWSPTRCCARRWEPRISRKRGSFNRLQL